MKGIITLCGSTKFKAQFEEVNRRLTWSGWIVLSVGSFHHSEKDHDVAGQIIARKVKLDGLHKEKIEMSQAVVIIDPTCYIGESTQSELDFATQLKKPIYWYEWNYHFDRWPQMKWTELLDESPDDLEPSEKETKKK